MTFFFLMLSLNLRYKNTYTGLSNTFSTRICWIILRPARLQGATFATANFQKYLKNLWEGSMEMEMALYEPIRHTREKHRAGLATAIRRRRRRAAAGPPTSGRDPSGRPRANLLGGFHEIRM